MRKPMLVQQCEWDTADRKIDIVLMVNAGISYAAIGRKLGIGGKRVKDIFFRAMESRAARWRWLERMQAFNSQLSQREAVAPVRMHSKAGTWTVTVKHEAHVSLQSLNYMNPDANLMWKVQ